MNMKKKKKNSTPLQCWYQIIKVKSIWGAFFPNNNFKSFSKGVKFKSNSKHKTLLLFDLLSTGTFESIVVVVNASFIIALCRLIWPPKACPIANSRPHIEHSCILGLLFPKFWDFFQSFCSSPDNFGLLWLARWPPKAWNDGNWRLQVLHSKTSAREIFLGLVSKPWESSIRQFAKSKLSIPPSSLILFIVIAP